MIKKLMQLRNTIVALLGIEFVLVLLTYMFLQNRVTLALMIYIYYRIPLDFSTDFSLQMVLLLIIALIVFLSMKDL